MRPFIFGSLLLLASGCAPTLGDAGGLMKGDVEGRSGLFNTGSAQERAMAEELAYEHLADESARLLQAIDGLSTNNIDISHGRASVRIDQDVDGVPVWGGQAIVHLDSEGEVTGLTDDWKRDFALSTVPSLTESTALDIASVAAGTFGTEAPEVELFVLRRNGEDHLAYKVQLSHFDGTSRTAMPVVFVDAHTGNVIFKYNNLQTVESHAHSNLHGSISFDTDQVGSEFMLRSSANNVGVYDFNRQSPSQSFIQASDLSPILHRSVDWNDAFEEVGVDAFFGLTATVEYLAFAFDRFGIDDDGGPTLKDNVMTGGVHYGENYAGAFWNGRTMVFGDGDGFQFGPLVGLDVAAHEMAHGVTQSTAGLIYENESGALNEATSDIIAAAVEFHITGDMADAMACGESVFTPHISGDALRDMCNPTVDGQSTDHYDERYIGFSDNGGVHWNSGIANLAFCKAVNGGNHPRSQFQMGNVTGIGMDDAVQVWYRALTNYMTPSTNFAQARAATLSAATDMYGPNSQQVATWAQAWALVGVGSWMDNPTGGSTTPAPTNPSTSADALDESGLSAVAKGQRLDFTVTVPEGATNLVVAMSGGTGDADLYVQLGQAPSETNYLCRPYRSGNNEVCEIAAPAAGVYHISLIAWTPFQGVDLSASFAAPEEAVADEADLIEEVVSGATGSQRSFTLDVPPGATTMDVSIFGGVGDADLYVRYGQAPTLDTFDCRPYQAGNNESCVLSNPTPGTYHITLMGYQAYSDVQLQAFSE